jgi:hypothetical protein
LRQYRSVGLAVSLALVGASRASAATITVNAGGNLQAAIDAAQPGDTIMLQAGATFTGPFRLRAKGGSAYITIRSSASDASLPGSGQRMTPSYASLLPKIKGTNTGAAIRTDPGATYWRLLFLEILPASSTASANLVEFGGTGTAQSTLSSVPRYLMLDRCYLHGDPSYGHRRGLALNSGNTQVVGSYFSDFKGVSQDTQAIMGWNGPGPYLIENNYLEGAAENLMFGGNDPSIPNLVPSDIVIRRNLIAKKTAWMTQSWTVKNLIELKNAQRVLIEGNTIENNWAAGQQGYSLVFTPRNQNGTAPWTVVRDVVVQSNIIRHVAAGFNISGYDNLATSQQTQNITIQNNLLYDVNTRWSIPNHPANGWLAVIGGGPKNITFDHNTVDNNGTATIFLDGNPPNIKSILGFEVTNNLLRDNRYGIYGNAIGTGIVGLNAYTPNAVVLNNTFAGGYAKLYPTGNYFPTVAQWLADFVDPAADKYRLVSTSASKGSGSDGKDLGVDFSALTAVLTGDNTRRGDFDGDRKTDITVFRPGTGTWYILKSGSSFASSAAYAWGTVGDVPVPGDFDGDGKADITVFRPSTGVWYILESKSSFSTYRSYTWGTSTDRPVPGDYDGDEKTDLAVYRPSDGRWYVLLSSSNYVTPFVYVLGGPSDIPAPADYDGDGQTDVAVYSPTLGQWTIVFSSSSYSNTVTYRWGTSGDIPIPGDYDGDAKADLAIYRPSNGLWYVLNSGASYSTYNVLTWGTLGDIPVPGDIDGDGRIDPTVYRPSTGTWYVLWSSSNYTTWRTHNWGIATDVPVLKRP